MDSLTTTHEVSIMPVQKGLLDRFESLMASAETVSALRGNMATVEKCNRDLVDKMQGGTVVGELEQTRRRAEMAERNLATARLALRDIAQAAARAAEGG